MSSLSSSSRWQIVSGRVLLGLCRRLPQLLFFYVVSVVLVGGILGLTYLAILTNIWYAVPVAAVVGSALWLIHARLMGRLAWLVQRSNARPAPVSGKKARSRAGK
jgi:hypothetical protein